MYKWTYFYVDRTQLGDYLGGCTASRLQATVSSSSTTVSSSSTTCQYHRSFIIYLLMWNWLFGYKQINFRQTAHVHVFTIVLLYKFTNVIIKTIAKRFPCRITRLVEKKRSVLYMHIYTLHTTSDSDLIFFNHQESQHSLKQAIAGNTLICRKQ